MSTRRTAFPVPTRLIAVAVAAALVLTACGDDDATPSTEPGSTAADGGDDVTIQPTTANPDLIQPVHTAIDDVVVIDETTLAVRFWNGSEPCARADVTVTEGDAEVTLRLVTGLHPNVAAMTCLTGPVYYEIPVELASPLGDRTIVRDDPAG